MSEVLACTCCGQGLSDTPEENVSHGQVPYPHDTGYGLCKDCGWRSHRRHEYRRGRA